MFSFMVLSTGRLMKVIFPGISASKEYRLQCRRSRFHLWVRSSPGEGIVHPLQCSWASLVARLLKNPPAVWETWVGKIPWMTAWQPTSVFLPGESPWTGKSGRLQSTGSQRVGQAWATKHTPQHKKWTRMSMSRWKDTYNSSNIHPLACMHACSVKTCLNSLWPHGLQPARLLCPRSFPGKYTGVGCYFLLHGIFLTKGLNSLLLCLLHWQVDSLPLAYYSAIKMKYRHMLQNGWILIHYAMWKKLFTTDYILFIQDDNSRQIYGVD